MDVLWATDFFSTEVWTLGGLVTFYVLFLIKLDTREIHIACVTSTPNEQWMKQPPWLDAFSERWIQSVKTEALSQMILVGERSLRYVLSECVVRHHKERPHQGSATLSCFHQLKPSLVLMGL
jgi:hypothetical protein